MVRSRICAPGVGRWSPVGVPSTNGKRRAMAGLRGNQKHPAQGSGRSIVAGPEACLRNLAKVGVAGSNPVVRSRKSASDQRRCRRPPSGTLPLGRLSHETPTKAQGDPIRPPKLGSAESTPQWAGQLAWELVLGEPTPILRAVRSLLFARQAARVEAIGPRCHLSQQVPVGDARRRNED
jgi:hypothetical protein